MFSPIVDLVGGGDMNKCRLDDGTIHEYEYDVMDDHLNTHLDTKYKFIGHGVIYSIDGVVKYGGTEGYFYRLR